MLLFFVIAILYKSSIALRETCYFIERMKDLEYENKNENISRQYIL